MTDEEVLSLLLKNNLEALTVNQLKGYLHCRGLSVKGKKAELIERVKSFNAAKNKKTSR